MNWQTITVQQFQDLYKVSIDNRLPEDERMVKTVAILHNMTEAQVDDMDLLEFKKLCAETVGILDIDKIPGKPERRIGGYVIEYNPARLKHRQYVEINHWMDNKIENMHLIMASLVKPTKFRYIVKDNKAEEHAKYANDILQQPIAKVYHACVFFCNLYTALINSTADYLETTGETKEGKLVAELLRSVTDGYTALSR